MNKDALYFIVPVKIGHESVVSVIEFVAKFIGVAKELKKPPPIILCFVVDPPEAHEIVQADIDQYLNTILGAFPVGVDVVAGRGSYGSSMAEIFYLLCSGKVKVGIEAVIVLDLTDDFFRNKVLQKVALEVCNFSACAGYFTRFGPNPFLVDSGFPFGTERDKSLWFRRWGRRFITFLFNRFVVRNCSHRVGVSDATLSFRVYPGKLFRGDISAEVQFECLCREIEGRSPFETQLILFAWALNREDYFWQTWDFTYTQTKSTLSIRAAFKALYLIWDMWYCLGHKGGPWRGAIYPRP